MGQYGNQPDFGTRAGKAIIAGNPLSTPNNLKPLGSAALYIGTGGTLVCKVVGGDADNGTSVGSICTVFKNIPDGTFFPVVVSNIYVNDNGSETTTCSDIIALY
jgi:hypothetical protein